MRDQFQHACQVRAAGSRKALTNGRADRWDSGEVVSRMFAGIEYAGKVPRSREQIWRNPTRADPGGPHCVHRPFRHLDLDLDLPQYASLTTHSAQVLGGDRPLGLLFLPDPTRPDPTRPARLPSVGACPARVRRSASQAVPKEHRR